jgi:23S rRNA (cytosine1962-C5)-methyltransferase
MNSRLKLKKNSTPRVLKGHPWVFAGEIEFARVMPNGSLVDLYTAKDQYLATGMYSAHSQIIWRRLSRNPIKSIEDHLSTAIQNAINRRKPETCRRLISAEGDLLPGLTVDQFEDVLVVQATTFAVDKWLPIIIDSLKKHLNPSEIIYKNTAPVRKKEGLELYVRTESGASLSPRWFCIDGIWYHLDLEKGQKTGFYLDQRHQYGIVSHYAKNKRVLDAFCNQGGFALKCYQAGASSVDAIDSSKECGEGLALNAERNDCKVTFYCENVFDFFTHNRGKKYDLIILDPPPFTRNKEGVEGAIRGYKELNLRAMQMLNSGGILATYSCSHHVNRDLFRWILSEASFDAGKEVKLLQETSQADDHTILLNMPETEYLKGMILQLL